MCLSVCVCCTLGPISVWVLVSVLPDSCDGICKYSPVLRYNPFLHINESSAVIFTLHVCVLGTWRTKLGIFSFGGKTFLLKRKSPKLSQLRVLQSELCVLQVVGRNSKVQHFESWGKTFKLKERNRLSNLCSHLWVSRSPSVWICKQKILRKKRGGDNFIAINAVFFKLFDYIINGVI